MNTPQETLIPPDCGRAYTTMVVAREAVEQDFRFGRSAHLLGELDRFTRKRFGAPAPREWVAIETQYDDDETVRVTATMTAPREGHVVQFEETGEQYRTRPLVTTEMVIAVVVNINTLVGDEAPATPEYLVFKGWDWATRLMVFGRSDRASRRADAL